jgi:hypothetical protein
MRFAMSIPPIPIVSGRAKRNSRGGWWRALSNLWQRFNQCTLKVAPSIISSWASSCLRLQDAPNITFLKILL